MNPIRYEQPQNEIDSVEFYILGSEDNKINSSVNIINKELFKDGKPIESGIYSLRMGTTDFSLRCRTCFHTKNECSGHFGSVKLAFPVQSPLFRGEILKWLKIICHQCGNIVSMLAEDEIKPSQFNKSITSSKDNKCKTCGFDQPTVFKDPKDFLRIMGRKSNGIEYRIYNDDIEKIFERITPEIVESLGKSKNYHPSKFILRTIPALPNADRPDVRKIKGGSRSNNNDNTTLLKTIVSSNEQIPLISSPEIRLKYENVLDMIELTYYSMVKEVPSGSTNSKLIGGTGQPMTSISSRLRGKEGRIRGNLEGKRVQHGGRTVITGDNNIEIDEVGVPISIARNLQIPEIVRPYNINRLMIYFLNKTTTYPGSSKIIKGDSGSTYYTGSIKDNVTLEYGDTIYRDMIDGDYVAMNRAPSLLYSAISGHRARILEKGDTFRLSVNVADTLYGGDFDGDAMSIYPPHSIVARNECAMLCNLKRWFISYKDKSPSMGIYHDNLIGIFELTKESTVIDRYHTFELLSQVKYDMFLHKDKSVQDVKIGRDIISLLLPEINYFKKSAFYKQEYSGFIQYNKNDTHVNIKRGKILSGRMDKKSVGQGVNDSLFHAVFNEYGCDVAIDLIHNMQQVSTAYLLRRGYTINYDDIAIKKDVLTRINDITASIINDSNKLTEKLRAGLITPPIGMTVEDYYENEQISILSPGDDFTEVVMSSLDHENNNLYKLVTSGAKGKPTNILQICSSIGQMSIGGKRMQRTFGFGRANPYFHRFHDEPQAVGFIPDSFVTGVSSLSAIAQQQDGRNGITTKALSTGVTGYHNRKSNKNLEAVIIDNMRSSVKYHYIVQTLYGDDGCDVRKVAPVDFSILMASNAIFDDTFKIDIKTLPKKYQNDKVRSLLEKEYELLLEDRKTYREGFMRIESYNVKDKLMSSQQDLPVNIRRIVDNVLYEFQDYIKSDVKESMSPFDWEDKIQYLKKKLLYCHFNEIQEKKEISIPDYIKITFTLFYMSIDTNLSYKCILEKNIDVKILDLIIQKICFKFKESLIEYGTSIGTIASECTSESMTQRILDSIHASGVSKANFLTRTKEVYGAKETSKMSMPYMDIYVKKEYENDISKMQEIANNIEMMNLRKFINRTQIFFEDYKRIIHPNYKDENDTVIKMFEKHNPNLKVPSDLIKWCVRFEFNHGMLIEKNLSFTMIVIRLKELLPLLHIVYTDENSEKIIMRIYMRRSLFKKVQHIEESTIISFVHSTLYNTVIRGIDGIISANVEQDYVARSYIDEDGSVKTKKISIIRTNGTNLSDIVDNPFIDAHNTTSNSIMEIAELYGIHAARQKIIIELRNMIADPDYKHYMLIADELTFTGRVTSIEKVGLDERNINNSLLSLSYSHPIQKVVDAALNNRFSTVHSNISSALMMGTTPDICANYNSVVMNEAFIQEHVKDTFELMDDL